MLKIRLRRMGKRHRPFYRVVVSDSRSVPSAPAVDEIGHYDPMTRPPRVNIDLERIEHWRERGARLTPSVAKLVKGTRTGRLERLAAEEAARPAKRAPKPKPAEVEAQEAVQPEAAEAPQPEAAEVATPEVEAEAAAPEAEEPAAEPQAEAAPAVEEPGAAEPEAEAKAGEPSATEPEVKAEEPAAEEPEAQAKAEEPAPEPAAEEAEVKAEKPEEGA